MPCAPAGPDALTFDLMSIGGKIRAGLGALGFKAPLPGGWARLAWVCSRSCVPAELGRLVRWA